MKKFIEELNKVGFSKVKSSNLMCKDDISVEVLGYMVIIRKKRVIENLDLELVNVYTIIFKGIVKT